MLKENLPESCLNKNWQCDENKKWSMHFLSISDGAEPPDTGRCNTTWHHLQSQFPSRQVQSLLPSTEQTTAAKKLEAENKEEVLKGSFVLIRDKSCK